VYNKTPIRKTLTELKQEENGFQTRKWFEIFGTELLCGGTKEKNFK
jgi:hypothetical protein